VAADTDFLTLRMVSFNLCGFSSGGDELVEIKSHCPSEEASRSLERLLAKLNIGSLNSDESLSLASDDERRSGGNVEALGVDIEPPLGMLPTKKRGVLSWRLMLESRFSRLSRLSDSLTSKKTLSCS
jgi:hypothetical protein